jgi:WD40 repeat protein
MSTRCVGFLFLALLVGGLPALPAAPAEDIARLIDRLGDDDEARRKEAEKQLEGLGQEALPALREAARTHADVDVRLRAAVLARAMHDKLFGELRRAQADRSWTIRVALSADGKRAVSSGDAVRLWEVDGLKALGSFGPAWQWGLYLTPDGKQVLCGGADHVVRLFEAATGKELQRMTGHTGEVWVASLTPDGKQAITGGLDGTLRVWDVATGKQLRTFAGVTDYPRCLGWSPDGKRVVVGHFSDLRTFKCKATVRVWDVESGKEVLTCPGHAGAITAVTYSRDGKRIASSSFDGTARVWDAETGKEVQCLKGHPGPVDWVTFTPDSRRAVTCGWDGDNTVRVWDVAGGKELVRYEGHTASAVCVAVTPDGKQALSCGKDGALRLWPLPK